MKDYQTIINSISSLITAISSIENSPEEELALQHLGEAKNSLRKLSKSQNKNQQIADMITREIMDNHEIRIGIVALTSGQALAILDLVENSVESIVEPGSARKFSFNVTRCNVQRDPTVFSAYIGQPGAAGRRADLLVCVLSLDDLQEPTIRREIMGTWLPMLMPDTGRCIYV